MPREAINANCGFINFHPCFRWPKVTARESLIGNPFPGASREREPGSLGEQGRRSECMHGFFASSGVARAWWWIDALGAGRTQRANAALGWLRLNREFNWHVKYSW